MFVSVIVLCILKSGLEIGINSYYLSTLCPVLGPDLPIRSHFVFVAFLYYPSRGLLLRNWGKGWLNKWFKITSGEARFQGQAVLPLQSPSSSSLSHRAFCPLPQGSWLWQNLVKRSLSSPLNSSALFSPWTIGTRQQLSPGPSLQPSLLSRSTLMAAVPVCHTVGMALCSLLCC